MKQNTKLTIKRMCISAMCLALCIVLPMAFHTIPNGGTMFSPMHFPVMIAGLACGPFFGLLVAVFGPFLSYVCTGMPGLSYLPSMIIECAFYGMIPYLVLKLFKFKKIYITLYIGLLIGMICGKITGGIVSAIINSRGTSENAYTIAYWFTSYIVKCWPGMILQIVLIPNITFLLLKLKLINYDTDINKDVIDNKDEEEIA